MSVRFHPQAIPDWCTVVEVLNEPEDPAGPRALPIDRTGRATVFLRDVDPGSVEIRWGYDDEP